jgi:uncharacterized protein
MMPVLSFTLLVFSGAAVAGLLRALTGLGGGVVLVPLLAAGLRRCSVRGTISGLLGIGSGAVKVLAMDRIMRIPFKVSTTTSNFMIGVTAAASAGIYLKRGYIDPGLAFPVMLGVLGGSLLGARILVGAPVFVLRIIFTLLIFALGVEMIVNSWRGNL